MEYSIKTSDEGDYIILTVVGEFTAKTFMKCIIESHNLGREMGIRNFLVDVTNAKNVDSAMGTYEFAYSDMKKTEGVDPLARVAGLVSPDDHSHDFVETASSNAGMFLKLFTDPNKAIDYLLRKSPSG
jgi:hypothetical protein